MDLRKLTWMVIGIGLILASVTCAPVDPKPNAGNTLGQRTETTGSGPSPVREMPAGLQHRLELAIDNARGRELDTTNGFWTVFHGIVGLGPSVTLRYPGTGKRVKALDYICSGGELRGLEFMPTSDGVDVISVSSPDMAGISQGHQDQFIAEIGQWGIPRDHKFTIKGKQYTYDDYVRYTQARASVKSKQELSWAILVIGQYCGTDARWTNGAGEPLRLEDLLRDELDASMDNAPCGGSHRLFDMYWVYRLHQLKGGQTEGIWKEIVDRTEKYKRIARQMQNSDGSFSTSFFSGRSSDGNAERRMNTTGHVFEWLSLVLSDKELAEPWMQDAANALAVMFFEIEGKPMESGSLYHATHGLLLYYARVFGPEKLGNNRPYFPGEPLDSAAFQKRMQ